MVGHHGRGDREAGRGGGRDRLLRVRVQEARACARCVDFAVVGDAEPVPLVEREVFATLAVGDRDERIDAGVDMLTDIHDRVAKLWRTAMEAAASDAEIDGWRVQWEEGRRVDTRRSLELILRREIDDVLLDLFWGIFSHEVYGMLVLDRGLDRAQYAERMRTAVTALVSGGRERSDPERVGRAPS